jgi:cell division protein FtsI/penicillin-binding protein 2
MRSGPILDAASRFRLGEAPSIPLKGVSSGFIPLGIPSDGHLANVAIGQGRVLASPLQMAIAMTGFANRDRVAVPRLVIQTQDPMTGDLDETFPTASTPLRYAEEAVDAVREGMWGTVNHALGTGRSAALTKPHVFGKTGTAQWFHKGSERRLGWFAGFADATDPKIAFAMVSEGAIGETMSGGRNAAPFAGNFFREVYAQPESFLVSVPAEILTPEPLLDSSPPGFSPPQPRSRVYVRYPRVTPARTGTARPPPQPRRWKRGNFFRGFWGSN